MKDALIGFAAAAAFRLVRRLILSLPDPCLARLLSFLHRRTSGDAGDASPLAELRDIFQSGPPLTATVRKIVREVDLGWLKSTARCLTRPGPYGVD